MPNRIFSGNLISGALRCNEAAREWFNVKVVMEVAGVVGVVC